MTQTAELHTRKLAETTESFSEAPAVEMEIVDPVQQGAAKDTLPAPYDCSGASEDAKEKAAYK